MASRGHSASGHRRCFVGMLGLFLISGCETARNPVESSQIAPEPLPPGIISVTSLVGEAARQAWIEGLTSELEDVNRQIRSAAEPKQELVQRAEWLEQKIAETTSTSPAEESLSPSATEAVDEDAGIISFGTQVFLPFGGPFAVIAHTTTSRATHITHAIRISKTVSGRTYTSSATDNTGFLHQSSLYTRVDLSGDCKAATTVDARTEHKAESLTFRRRNAVSDNDASCNPPPSCESDKDGPISYSCTGGGSGGDGTPMLRCYTVTTTYYWYYPETGVLEYRYTETTTWCESTE